MMFGFTLMLLGQALLGITMGILFAYYYWVRPLQQRVAALQELLAQPEELRAEYVNGEVTLEMKHWGLALVVKSLTDTMLPAENFMSCEIGPYDVVVKRKQGKSTTEVLNERQSRIDTLEAAIRTHRDQKADDRCWMDDKVLYETLGPVPEGCNVICDPTKMLENCKRYIAVRCQGGPWKSYQELEEQIVALTTERDAANEWKLAIIEAAVVGWTFKAEHETNPKAAINALLCWERQMALDPSVSEPMNYGVQSLQKESENRVYTEEGKNLVGGLAEEIEGLPLTCGENSYAVAKGVRRHIAKFVREWKGAKS